MRRPSIIMARRRERRWSARGSPWPRCWDAALPKSSLQAAGKVAIDVKHIGCDLLSISGHKMNAPQGVGALYVRKGTGLRPMLYGGSHERSRRAGTENVPAIVALGKAAETAREAFVRGD